MERVNIPGFGPGKVEIDIYTFDALPNTRFKRVGEAFQPIVDGFYVGQEVWCDIRLQKGVVSQILHDNMYPVKVVFADKKDSYTLEGVIGSGYKPSLRPLQKFNVGQRVKDSQGNEGVVISNTNNSEYPVIVQWDGDFTGRNGGSYATYTLGGNCYSFNTSAKDIIHA